MSAVLSKNPVPLRLPHLAPEIWLSVFQFATYVPGEQDLDIDDPFNLDAPVPGHSFLHSLRRQQSDLRTALRTKRRLVRVCKYWHMLVTPFLYRSVYIGYPRTVTVLRLTLRDSQRSANASNTCTLGAQIRRLDLALCTPFKSQDDVDVLADLFQYMPNLQLFAVGRGCSMPEGPSWELVYRNLGNFCGPSIRGLSWDWKTVNDRPPVHEGVLKLISKCPYLQYLHPPVVIPFLPFLTPDVVLSDVTCLTLIPRRPTPSTTTLIHCHNARKAVSMIFINYEFETTFSLTSLAPVTALFVFCANAAVWPHFQLGVLRHMLSLEHVIVALPDDMLLMPTTIFQDLLPSVTHLGLQHQKNQYPDECYRWLFRVLGDIRSPTLKVVRFLNSRAFEDLRYRHRRTLRQCLGLLQMHQKNFRLEDPFGQEVTCE